MRARSPFTFPAIHSLHGAHALQHYNIVIPLSQNGLVQQQNKAFAKRGDILSCARFKLRQNNTLRYRCGAFIVVSIIQYFKKLLIKCVVVFLGFFVDMAAPPAIGFEGLQEPAHPYEAIGKFSSYQIILKGYQDVVKIIGRS